MQNSSEIIAQIIYNELQYSSFYYRVSTKLLDKDVGTWGFRPTRSRWYSSVVRRRYDRL